MEIILKEDIAGLGYKNDIVKVATESAKKVLAENERQRAHKLAKIKADAEAQAAKLNGVKVTISAKVNEDGTIFGGVGAAQVAEALAAKGFEVDRKAIVAETVKAVGEYTATINLHKEVKAEVAFEVVAEAAE